MTDISKYKSVALKHDSWKKATVLSSKLVNGGKISLAQVVNILLTREYEKLNLSPKALENIKIKNRKKKNGKG